MTYKIEMHDELCGRWISASPRQFTRRATAERHAAKMVERFGGQFRVVGA